MVVGPIARSIAGTYLFGKETSFATGGTANKDIGLVKNFSFDIDQKVEERHGQGSAKAVYVKGGLVEPKGNIEIEVQHGRPIEWAMFGGTTTHALTGSDTTHTFVWADALPSLKVDSGYEMGATDFDNVCTGLTFGSSTLTMDVKGILSMRSDFLCQDAVISATTVPAAVVDTDAPLGGFEASLSLGGAAVNYVQSWEITANANTKSIPMQSQRKPAWIASHVRNFTWKATIGLENTTQLARVLGTTAGVQATEPTSFAAVFAGNNGVTLGSGRREVGITLSGCQAKATYKANLGDFVVYDLSGAGIPSAGTYVDNITTGNW